MPLVNQDGEHCEIVRAKVEPVALVDHVEVLHDEIVFLNGSKVMFRVTRPTHPGAGLALDFVEAKSL